MDGCQWGVLREYEQWNSFCGPFGERSFVRNPHLVKVSPRGAFLFQIVDAVCHILFYTSLSITHGFIRFFGQMNIPAYKKIDFFSHKTMYNYCVTMCLSDITLYLFSRCFILLTHVCNGIFSIGAICCSVKWWKCADDKNVYFDRSCLFLTKRQIKTNLLTYSVSVCVCMCVISSSFAGVYVHACVCVCMCATTNVQLCMWL